MDSDTDIKLYAGGTVSLVEYGYAIAEYQGTYSIRDGSIIALTLAEYGSWPKMVLARDGSFLQLTRADGRNDFRFGRRAGATVPGDAATFWPFRQIDSKE